jgi:hypothetical protein
VTKASERKIRQSLERQRVKLEERKLELSESQRAVARERETWRRERTEVVALLQLLTERFGLPSPDPDAPLATLLERLLSLAPQPQTVPNTPPPGRVSATSPSPRPLRPTPLPVVEHKLLVVPAQDRTRQGYGARCVCGWISAVLVNESAALVAAQQHADRMGVRRAQ